MNELLKRLLDADILSEDTKNELESAFKAQIQEAIELAKKETGEQVRVELTEQWLTERDALIEAIDEKITMYLREEVDELKSDISAFRDLEAEYAERVVEHKSQMAEELQGDLVELIEKLDSFLEIRMNAEFEELREDIQESRKLQFGQKIFESFVTEYRNSFIDDDSTEADLRKVTEKYEQEVVQRKNLEKKMATVQRTMKIEQILKPLSGKQREIMETVLKSVPTEGLEEAYKTFIGRVLKESEDKNSEKETSVLAESKSTQPKNIKTESRTTITKTGDTESLVEESVDEEVSVSVSESYRRLAGLM